MLVYYTVGVAALMGAISPGPDLAVVAKNALLHQGRQAILTSLGIAVGMLIHSLYCIIGLGLLITHSPILFNFLKYAGACYLIYLGIKSIFTLKRQQIHSEMTASPPSSHFFRVGLLTNLLNPTCPPFMLSLFTLVVGVATPVWLRFFYGFEIALITFIWFLLVSLGLAKKFFYANSTKANVAINIVMSIILIGFGVSLFFVTHGAQ